MAMKPIMLPENLGWFRYQGENVFGVTDRVFPIKKYVTEFQLSEAFWADRKASEEFVRAKHDERLEAIRATRVSDIKIIECEFGPISGFPAGPGHVMIATMSRAIEILLTD